jgi:prophage regulatory protein
MIISHLSSSTKTGIIEPYVRVIRHNSVCEKLGISSAKLFDIVARGLFPKPFTIIPGGRAVGWLESDVNRWVFERKDSALPEHTAKQSSVVERPSRGRS